MNFLTVSETAERLNLTRQGVQYLIQQKKIEAVWMLGRWAIPAEEVTRLKRSRNGKAKAA